MKYLTLIQAIALLHQYQREVKKANHRGQVIEYIEVTQDDIVLANQLAHEVLGRTLDEMPPQTRKLLLLIQDMVKEQAQRQHCQPNEIRFTRRDIRAFTHWSDSQLKNHCQRLIEMEYLLLHGGSRGHLLRYELLWDGQNNSAAHLCGLLDVGEPEKETAGNERKSDLKENKSTPSLGQVWPKSGEEKTAPGQTGQGQNNVQVWANENTVIKGKKKKVPLSLPEGEHTAQPDITGDDGKSGVKASQSTSSLGQVRVKSGQQKARSAQTGQGQNDAQIWVDENAVINNKNKKVSLPSPVMTNASDTEPEAGHGKP
ncbi:DNA primase [Xenorhabdus szentirmaii]|nr:DNA primase [Xenorhabdus szentirmaii DSM 16338]PHM44352.1 DNA primase [Xenorhabdus szentirmaii]